MAYSLATLTTGLNVLVVGDLHTQITGVATLVNATRGKISFLGNSKYKKYLQATKASAVILAPEYSQLCPTIAVISTNPYLTYAKIAERFVLPKDEPAGIHDTVVMGDSCNIAPDVSIAAQVILGKHVTIGTGVSIGPGCIIGDNCTIAAKTKLHARVSIYNDVVIGHRVDIASGTVICSDGFGFASDNDGSWYKVPQLGRVVIADDVAIGANCCIDRGAIEDTYIGEGVKLDNLIQIGHNVKIGAHTIIAGCVGIAGSVSIGQYCLIGGGVGIGGHLTIADRVAITGMTVVTKSIHNAGVYSSGVGGVVSNKLWRRYSARVHQLEDLVAQVKRLEAQMQQHFN